MSLYNITDPTYFKTNNELNRPVDNRIPLHKDKEALTAFLIENVQPNVMPFESTNAYIDYLLNNLNKHDGLPPLRGLH